MTDTALPGDPAPSTARPGRRPEVIALAAAMVFLAAIAGFGVGIRSAGDRPSKVDVGFLQDMIAHHEQAVELAMTALDGAENRTVRGFAQEVLTFQNYEIGLMEATLRAWGRPRQGGDTAMGWMGMAVPLDEMPGLATPEQMRSLRESRASDTDALFLALMSVHHLGGLEMAEEAGRKAESGFVRDLAQRIARNQQVEVREYSAARKAAGLTVPAGFTDPPTPPAMPHGVGHG